jgi:hypothetical protein
MQIKYSFVKICLETEKVNVVRYLIFWERSVAEKTTMSSGNWNCIFRKTETVYSEQLTLYIPNNGHCTFRITDTVHSEQPTLYIPNNWHWIFRTTDTVYSEQFYRYFANVGKFLPAYTLLIDIRRK